MNRRRPSWLHTIRVCPFLAILAGCSGPSPEVSTSSPAPVASASPTSPLASDALRGVPSWATEDHFAGSLDPSEAVRVQVHLRPRDQGAAEEELAAISDPKSPRYGRFLSDDDYAAKFAPSDDDVARVSAHLVQSGFTVSHVPRNRAYVAAAGNVAAVERAFSLRLGLFAAKGRLRRAPRDPVQLPSAIASRVEGVLGLAEEEFRSFSVHVGGLRRGDGVLAPPTATAAEGACSSWYGQIADTTDSPYPGYSPLTYLVCGYHPKQLRDGYGLSGAVQGGDNGTGQLVAIVDAFLSPTLLKDSQTYFANNDPAYPLLSSQFSAQWAPGASSPPDTGWYSEQSLDVQAVHAIAPGAEIAYVGAQSAADTDLIAAINFVIDNRLATIVSNSYGGVERGAATDFAVWHNVATEAGLKGIGLYFASGDYGDNSTLIGTTSADFPASLDNATAVGGTSLALGQADQRLFEVGWETGASLLEPTSPPGWSPPPPGFFVYGGGGGASTVYAQPSWQAGIVPPVVAFEYGVPARAVPDVSMVGDPFTGYFVGTTDPTTGVYSEQPIGGTSLSCPLFSATMALAQQRANRGFGFANPTLYSARRVAFRDILPLAVPQAVTYPAPPGSGLPPYAVNFDYRAQTIRTALGWDAVTGLGVPSGATFLSAFGGSMAFLSGL